MILWFPQHIPKSTVFKFLEDLDSNLFQQIIQDKIHSRYPAFVHTKIYVDSDLHEIDTQCSICFEQGDYQLSCGHVFHKRCIQQWKMRQHSCPNCRADI